MYSEKNVEHFNLYDKQHYWAQKCHDTSNQNYQSELGLIRHSSWQNYDHK